MLVGKVTRLLLEEVKFKAEDAVSYLLAAADVAVAVPLNVVLFAVASPLKA